MSVYYRPIVCLDHARPPQAQPVAGGWAWFAEAERIERAGARTRVPLSAIPADIVASISRPRAPIAGLDMSRPNLMGILNATPDSFSDGGLFSDPDTALAHARAMLEAGADIIDVGGESTRPGAEVVPEDEEIRRTAPLISAIRREFDVPISIDTRKASVAKAALEAGADMVNDVSALAFDPRLAPLAAARGVPVCLMHARGDPKTMQDDPRYGDVLLDVYDALAARIEHAVAAGLSRSEIVVDPGIGFGKTVGHNLALLRGISLFHALGCPILLGASRKRFIGTLSGAEEARSRGPGSVAVALGALAQGVQILRVHDIADTKQAVTLWRAVNGQ